MTEIGMIPSDELGRRVGWWLRSLYPSARAKSVANEFNVSEATARRWLSDERPTSDILADMASRFGWRFVHFVFEPVCGTPAIRVQMDALDRRLARLEMELEMDNANGALAFARVDARTSDSRGQASGCVAAALSALENAVRKESE